MPTLNAAAKAARKRISAISASNAPKRVTRADLAFIDAAIQLLRAAQAPLPAGPSVKSDSPVACDVVDAVADFIVVVAPNYMIYNSSMIGEDSSAINALQLANRLNLLPNISLERMIQARDQLAEVLNANG